MPEFNLDVISTRLPHIADLITAYEGDAGTTANVPVALDITPIKAALADYIDDRIMLLHDAYGEAPDVQTDLLLLRDELVFYAENTITDTVEDTVEVNTDIKASLQQCLADFSAAIAMAKPYTDGRCRGEGRYELSQDTGQPEDTDTVHCRTCDGFGAVAQAEQAKPMIIWPELPGT